MKKSKYIFLFLFLLIGIAFLLLRFGVFDIKKIEYNKNINISLKEIKNFSGLSKTNNYFFISSADIENNLINHPYVEEVKCIKKFPNKIILDLKFREEFSAILYSGLYLTTDDKLNVLKAEEKIGEIFLIKGFHVKSFNIGEKIVVENESVLNHAIELIHLLKKSHIEALPILSYYGGSIELELNSEYRVKFGDGENIERKFNNFVDIYDDLSLKNANCGVIDVSNEGLPSYRPFGE